MAALLCTSADTGLQPNGFSPATPGGARLDTRGAASETGEDDPVAELQMNPRIPLLAPDEAEGDAVKALASPTGHMALFRLLAHAPDTVLPVMRLGRAILAKQRLDGRLRELAILVALRLVDGRYEWPQHVEIARAEGLDEDSIAAVERLDFACPFPPDERAVVEFTRQSVETVRVGDQAFADLARVLAPREIVELSLTIGYYLMLARLTEAVDLGPEEAQGEAVLAATRATSRR